MTPTKNESLPEIRRESTVKCDDCGSDNDFCVYDGPSGLLSCTACGQMKQLVLTREAPTEGVVFGDWTREDIAELRERLVSSGISAFMAGESNKAKDRVFVHTAITNAWQLLDEVLATPPAPQRLAQGECRHSLWSPAGGYCLDCGYSPVGPDEESAIDAAVGLAKVVLRLPVDLLGEIDHRAQQSGCVRNAYLRQLLAEHHTQPSHQDRVEVNQRLRDAIEGECDGLGITEKSADAILRYIGFHPAGRIVGGSDIDGVWVIEATGHSGLMPNQLLVRYDDYLRDVNSKYRCDDCGGDGRQCLAGRSAHRSNWYACETCNGAGTIAALTEAKQQDNRALAESVFNIPVPARGFHEGWRDEEIWQWALRAAAAHILGTTQSEAEKLLTTSSTGEPEAKQQGRTEPEVCPQCFWVNPKQQGPGEAVAYRVVGPDGAPCPAFGKWVDVGFWHSSPAIRPVLREGFRYEYAYAGSPQVEAKPQAGDGAQVIEGTVVYQREDASKPKVCKCCEGPHVYSAFIEWEGERQPNIGNALETMLRRKVVYPRENEGKRVRLTVEVIAAAAKPSGDR